MAWIDAKLFLRTLSPKIMSKAVRSFDRATIIVVTGCWCAALIALAAAIYALTLSASAHRASDATSSVEPVLPKIIHKPMDLHTVQTMFDRMQHRFPDVIFSVHGTDLGIASTKGANFHQWLAALSYIDTISPELHWSFQEFCVGDCKNAELMHAVLKGERITFEAAMPESKN